LKIRNPKHLPARSRFGEASEIRKICNDPNSIAAQESRQHFFPSFRLNETCPGESREPESSIFNLS
jgi:hypothetical protein